MRYMRWNWSDLADTPTSIVSFILEQMEEESNRRQAESSERNRRGSIIRPR